MDTEAVTKEEREFDEAFANLPLEVENFMWSDAYSLILDAIKTVLQLTEEQKEFLKIKSYEILLGISSMEKTAKELLEKGFSQELASKSLYLVNEEILGRAKNINEFYTTTEDEQESVATVAAPSPADVLESLKARMTTASAIAPSARKSEGTLSDIKKVAPVEKPKIDPYRELPQ